MRWGIKSGYLDRTFPYVDEITFASSTADVPLALLYAIAWHETIEGEANGDWNAATVISPDGGHGLCQLTSSYPADWAMPYSNARYACTQYITPAALYWNGAHYGFTGDTLVRCIAATFNAGLAGALLGHLRGNVDLFTTAGYARAVLAIYRQILARGRPD